LQLSGFESGVAVFLQLVDVLYTSPELHGRFMAWIETEGRCQVLQCLGQSTAKEENETAECERIGRVGIQSQSITGKKKAQ
jgi:hypothetical protein